MLQRFGGELEAATGATLVREAGGDPIELRVDDVPLVLRVALA
jgi:Fe2+ transport system protein FeoA